jgi:hypothetical protein
VKPWDNKGVNGTVALDCVNDISSIKATLQSNHTLRHIKEKDTIPGLAVWLFFMRVRGLDPDEIQTHIAMLHG